MEMSSDHRLKDVLPDFQRFLLDKRLASERHVPFYALRVSQFLAFANKDKEVDVETLVRRFLDHLEARGDVSAGLARQAGEALQLYLFQYKNGIHFRELRFGQVDAPALSSVGDMLSEMRGLIRLRHYSYSTEQTYLDWAKRFFAYITETRKTKINACDGDDVKNFLSHLALRQKVSSSTQNQAFRALLFLFREVLRQDLGDLAGTVRAKRGTRLPVVLSVEEVKSLFAHLSGRGLLIAQLIYGSGLRLMECARLRVKDIDFDGNAIFVRGGKGDNDRSTVRPHIEGNSRYTQSPPDVLFHTCFPHNQRWICAKSLTLFAKESYNGSEKSLGG